MEAIANFRLEKNRDGLVLAKIEIESEIIPKQHTFALPIKIESIKTEFMQPKLEINADVSDPVQNDMHLRDLKQSKILSNETEVVTGVSRSGRVMKKSSKLLDFEIPQFKHKFRKRRQGGRHTSSTEQIDASLPRSLLTNLEVIKNEPVDLSDENFTENKPWNLLEEMSTTKNIFSDGKMITKARRKVKRRPRLTAYTAWGKNVRQQLLSENPNLDFPSTSRKLAQLWAEVPANEKYNWRRKAKRLTSHLNRKKSFETIWITGVK